MIPKDILSKIVEAGTWAPSADNCQPWKFTWDGTTLEVIHDESRAKFLYNVNNIASLVTFGAVIENIVIAANHFGYKASISYFPHGHQELVIANITFNQQTEKTEDVLFPWIKKRMVNRKFYSKRKINEKAKEILCKIENAYPGTHVHWTDSKQDIKELATLVAKGDRILFEHPELHGALFRWIRWSKDEGEKTKDGMGLDVLELNPFQKRLFPILSSWKRMQVLNRFGLSWFASTQSYRLLRSAPAACLITTDDTDRLSYLTGGRLMQRIWLTTSSLGIAFQPVTGITFLISIQNLAEGSGLNPVHQEQIMSIQDRLKDIFPFDKDNGLIMLFRMGWASSPTTHSIRRPVEEVLSIK